MLWFLLLALLLTSLLLLATWESKMAVFLSPVGGAGAQFFDNNGNPLTGGKLFTYAAGTTTPQATYTSSAGVTFHTNPIILDAAGRVPGGGEIWLADNQIYKFVLKTSNDVLLATWDQLTGVNSNFVNFTAQTEVQTATAGQTVFTLTSISYVPATGSLTVYVDGVNQYEGLSYIETDSTTVTFTAGLHVGAEVKFTTAIQTTGNATDASVVSYTPPFSGSVATTVEDKLAQTVSVKDFGAVGDGVTDDTVAIQAALDSLSSSGGCVYFPPGTYNVNSALSITGSTSGITLLGADQYSVLIRSFVSGVMLTSNISYLHIENLSIYGNKTAPAYWITGYKGVRPNGNLTMTNVNIRFFDVCVEWGGGFYHKYINCTFGFSNICGDGYDGNNVSLIGSRLTNFNNGFRINGGTGDFVFQSGAIEAWSGTAIAQVSGAGCAITVRDTYVENYPTTNVTGTGLNPFTAAVIVNASKGDVCFSNNNVQTKGIFRAIFADGIDAVQPININAQGNKWVTSNTSASDIQFFYYVAGQVGRVAIEDPNVVPIEAGHTGSYTPVFVPVNAQANAVGYNSLTKQALLPAWTNLTLLNGWVNVGSGNPNLSYYKDPMGRVYIRGLINGTSSTDVTVANLPAEFRPEFQVWCDTANTSGTARTARVLTNGDVRVETVTPGTNIIVDISFRAFQ
jgi:hypothetical protein